jgi:toxin CptA
MSEMPQSSAWPLAALSLGYGGLLARRQARMPDCRFVWAGDGHGPITHDGSVVEALSLHWRGPLAFMRFRGADGRIRHLSWWPDTLGTGMRRELRLALDRHAASRQPLRMAG